MTTKKNRLGRGIDDLVSPTGLDKLLSEDAEENNYESGKPLFIKLEEVDNNPDQPRKQFKESELKSLAQSIKTSGIIEPLIVTKKENGTFELVAGERRLRAAKIAGLQTVPIIIREIEDNPAEKLVLALVENICRENLNPIEEAESFSRLEKEFQKTHQEIANITGRERPTITNTVRLLKLPDFIQNDIIQERISAGHGRAMLGLTDHSLFQEVRTEVITKHLTVRQTEALVKNKNRMPDKKDKDLGDNVYYEALAKSFSDQLGGLKVKINNQGINSKIEIYYSNQTDLELLMEKIKVMPL